MPQSRPAEPAVALDLALLRDWPLPCEPDGDKYSRGTVMVVGGCLSTPGAPLLAGLAALRMGAGKLQIATDERIAVQLALAAPEAMAVPAFAGEADVEPGFIDLLGNADSVLVGPGLPPAGVTTSLLEATLEHADDKAVLTIDAAAIEALAEVDETLVRRRAGRLVITPNRQEMARLLDKAGADCNDVPDERADAVAVAERFGAVVASFGLVVDGERVWETAAGHQALGTSGSGDVCAGLVAGAAARCGDPAQAACWGMLLHAIAGEQLGRRAGQLGILAREIVDEVARIAPLVGDVE